MISEDIDFSNVDFSLEAVQEKVKGWANQLVDLSGRNNLITFRGTKTTTIIPTDEAAKRLISGDSLLISDILPLDEEGNEKAARTVIKREWEAAKDKRDHFELWLITEIESQNPTYEIISDPFGFVSSKEMVLIPSIYKLEKAKQPA